jgi:hypothetical protein
VAVVVNPAGVGMTSEQSVRELALNPTMANFAMALENWSIILSWSGNQAHL